MIDEGVLKGTRREKLIVKSIENSAAASEQEALKRLSKYLDELKQLERHYTVYPDMVIKRMRLQRKYKPDDVFIALIMQLSLQQVGIVYGALAAYAKENARWTLAQTKRQWHRDTLDALDAFVVMWMNEYLNTDEVNVRQRQRIRYDDRVIDRVRRLFRTINTTKRVHRGDRLLSPEQQIGNIQRRFVEGVHDIYNRRTVDIEHIERNLRTRITNWSRNGVANILNKFGCTVERVWVCTFHNSRDWHISMHGQRRGVGEAFISGLGNRLMFPHDTSAPPADWVNCLCYITINITSERITDADENSIADGMLNGTLTM